MDAFTINTGSFEGPLDALLNLIEARKLSISAVSLADVCDAYLAYVEKLPEMPLGETSQFILIASTLLLIKSRALLPTLTLSDDEEESVHELESRLKRYAVVRAAAQQLRRVWGVSPLILARRAPSRPAVFAPGEANQDTILYAARRLVAALPKPEKIAKATVAPVLALEDVIKRVHHRLTTAIHTRFSDLTRAATDRHEIIVYFLAVLELVRGGSASATQERLFEDITVEIEDVATPQYGV